ncbi:hypothetical protein [Sneathiella glossodoripedis]|uniref:hypothetical protein n=1 Tax=Sneathiella glossodoripedis TaxID=418853 RepID=UPI000470D0A6|nr:hypothetical protein [Sneathiella glossodoripedis]
MKRLGFVLVFSIWLILFGAFYLFDALFDHQFSREIYYKWARDDRKIEHPELYDDTYRPGALWPQEGSQTYRSELNLAYRGKTYTGGKNIRCYQDASFSSQTN